MNYTGNMVTPMRNSDKMDMLTFLSTNAEL